MGRRGILHPSGVGVFRAGNLEARRTVCSRPVSLPCWEVYVLLPRSAHVHLEEGRENDYFINKSGY